jgi:hypothetical protein
MPGMKSIAFAGALCLLAGTAYAADGILIVQKTTTGAGNGRTNQIQMDATHMRVESANPMGGTMLMIFDGAKQTMYTIDPVKKTYSEMTKEDVDKVSDQMAGAMAQMQQALKGMSPEQRARIDAMMKGRGAPSTTAPVKPTYKRVGTDTVGKWKCDRYDGYEGAEKTSEICTVDPRTLGFTTADFAVAQQMMDFFQRMIPPSMRTGASVSQMFSVGTNELGFSGIPVRTINGSITTEISEVTRQAFPASTFAVPAGFQKTESPFAALGRGRGRQ